MKNVFPFHQNLLSKIVQIILLDSLDYTTSNFIKNSHHRV